MSIVQEDAQWSCLIAPLGVMRSPPPFHWLLHAFLPAKQRTALTRREFDRRMKGFLREGCRQTSRCVLVNEQLLITEIDQENIFPGSVPGKMVRLEGFGFGMHIPT